MSGSTLIASHLPAVRAWLRAHLPPCERLIEVCDGLTACQQALIDQPDLAIVSATLPHLDGEQTAVFLQTHLPQCRIVVLPDPRLPADQAFPLNRWYQMQLTVLIDAALHLPVAQPA